MKVLAIIPARGGSKGLPKKNIRPLCGEPLIVHTIKQALSAHKISSTIVATEDAEIAGIAEKYGVDVVKVPPQLTQDNSPVIDVMFYALDLYKGFDIVLKLECTSPLRKEDDLDNAIGVFGLSHADSLTSLGEIRLENPYIAMTVEEGCVKQLIATDAITKPRAQWPKAYFPYGVIYLSRVDTLRKCKSFYQERTIPYFIERWQNYEIDDIYDFICIGAIMKHRKECYGDFA